LTLSSLNSDDNDIDGDEQVESGRGNPQLKINKT